MADPTKQAHENADDRLRNVTSTLETPGFREQDGGEDGAIQFKQTARGLRERLKRLFGLGRKRKQRH